MHPPAGTRSPSTLLIKIKGMGQIPIFVEVAAKHCLIVGGGELAARKAQILVEAGAAVAVVSPDLNPELRRLASRDAIVHIARAYQYGDMSDAVLVYAATNDTALHRALYAEAAERNVLINVGDTPELCSFMVPAVLKRGELTIAVSTSGSSPAFARQVRDHLAALFGPEYAVVLKIMRAARTLVHQRERDRAERARILGALAASPLLELVRNQDSAGINRLLVSALEADLKTLGIADDQIIPQMQAQSAKSEGLSQLRPAP